jgi:hypothetical protein
VLGVRELVEFEVLRTNALVVEVTAAAVCKVRVCSAFDIDIPGCGEAANAGRCLTIAAR